MARQEIDLTTPQPNGKMGEPTKSAWEKVNDMTAELYEDIDEINYQFSLGSELAYAETSTSSSTSGATTIDVPGMAFAFNAPNQPVYIEFGGALRSTVASASSSINLVVNGSTVSSVSYTGNLYIFLCRTYRVFGVQAGSVVNVKVTLTSYTAGSNADLFANAQNKPYLIARR